MNKPHRSPHPTTLLFALFAASLSLDAATVVNVDGQGPSRTFQGIGMVNSSGSSKLLQDYPEAQQRDILDLLFRPKFGAGLQLVKNEIGADNNTSSGTEPSHWRDPSGPAVARGVNFWIAREAGRRNPAMQFAALRWATPAWIGDDADCSRYLLSYLDLMIVNGTPVDFIGPGINEADYTPGLGRFIKETFKPALDAGGYKSRIVISDDVDKHWGAAPAINADPALKAAVFAISSHYTDASTPEAKKSGLPLLNTESDTGMVDWDRGIWVARRIATAFSAGRQDMWLYQPALDCVGENIRYQHKGILTANTPWSGHFEIHRDLWLTAQFTQFADVGWRILETGSGAVDGDNAYVSFKDPRSDHYSVVIVNAGRKDVSYTFNTAHLSNAPLSVWTSNETNQFVRQSAITPENGAFSVTVPAGSVYSLTTTTGQRKGEPSRAIPPPRDLALPYSDAFSDYAVGAQPRYFHDQNGAFEIAGDGEGGRALRQVVSTIPRPWWHGNHQPPFTVMGPGNLSSYQVGVDVRIPDDSASAGLVARLTWLDPMSPAKTQPEGYTLLLDGAGKWLLKKSAGATVTLLSSGLIGAYDNARWHKVKLAVHGTTIAACVDGVEVATVSDDSFSSGNVALATDTTRNDAWPQVLFRNFRIDPIGRGVPAFVQQADDGDPAVFSFPADDWKLKKTDNFTELKRTRHSTGKAGASVEFSFRGTQVSLVGVKEKTGGKADVYIDDELRAAIDTSAPATQSRNSLFNAHGLKPGVHTLRLVVRSGTVTIDFAEAESFGADAEQGSPAGRIKRGGR